MITYDYSNTKKGLKSVVPQVFNFDPISLIFPFAVYGSVCLLEDIAGVKWPSETGEERSHWGSLW